MGSPGKEMPGTPARAQAASFLLEHRMGPAHDVPRPDPEIPRKEETSWQDPWKEPWRS